MNKNAYWRKREEEQLKHYISEETELQRIMAERYSYMLRQIQVQINDFYARYARREQITLAEAMQRVSKMDVQAFGAKAKKYVEEKDFTPKANQELRLYNATMRINRLELLKANIGLEMIDGFNDLEKELDQGLTKRTEDELKRQEDILRREAGILNTTVFDNAKTVQTIVNASFNNATWSERIWGNQTQLKNELSSLLTQGLIQGKNPITLAPAIERLFGVSRRAAERLMVTEMARVQTDAQMESYKRNDIDQYVFISVDTACSHCMALNDNHYSVKDMMPGENAPPIHPNCRCSTAAYIDREAIEKDLANSENNVQISNNQGIIGFDRSFGRARFKTGEFSQQEYSAAKSLWKEYKEIELKAGEKAKVVEELDNNLTAEERVSAVVSRPIGNYRYTAINLGHATYKIINKEVIEGVSTSETIIDEVMDELFGKEWRQW